MFIIQDRECGGFGSREWNYECQGFCDCNKDDGGERDQCKYCCKIDDGKCHRRLPTGRYTMIIYQG